MPNELFLGREKGESSRPLLYCFICLHALKGYFEKEGAIKNPPNPLQEGGGFNEPLFVKRGWGDLIFYWPYAE